MQSVKIGLERLVQEKPSWMKNKRLGLLCNQASVDNRLMHASKCIKLAFPGQLMALFSPQHGFYAEKQDNMKESPHTVDPESGMPVFSLYGASREPSKEQLELIDLLIIDLQDVGCRVYTYIWTMFLAMKACARHGVEVAILDRPNPVGGEQVEGNLLKRELYSFVGLAPIPIRHGMTIAELSLLFREVQGDGMLHIMPMKGWERSFYFDDTGLPWVMPSPNMPCSATADVYSGQVLLEGTNLSEGRGTTRPFEIFGAPWLDAGEMRKRLAATELDGFILRRQDFEPTFHKYAGRHCSGIQIHVTDRKIFRPYIFTLSMLSHVMTTCRDHFTWTPPPYEYDFENLPFDLITGDRIIRNMVEDGASEQDFTEILRHDEQNFSVIRQDFLIY